MTACRSAPVLGRSNVRTLGGSDHSKVCRASWLAAPESEQHKSCPLCGLDGRTPQSLTGSRKCVVPLDNRNGSDMVPCMKTVDRPVKGLPVELDVEIKRAAAANLRSANQEIIFRLRQSFEREDWAEQEYGVSSEHLDRWAERVRAHVADQRKRGLLGKPRRA